MIIIVMKQENISLKNLKEQNVMTQQSFMVMATVSALVLNSLQSVGKEER